MYVNLVLLVTHSLALKIKDIKGNYKRNMSIGWLRHISGDKKNFRSSIS